MISYLTTSIRAAQRNGTRATAVRANPLTLQVIGTCVCVSTSSTTRRAWIRIGSRKNSKPACPGALPGKYVSRSRRIPPIHCTLCWHALVMQDSTTYFEVARESKRLIFSRLHYIFHVAIYKQIPLFLLSNQGFLLGQIKLRLLLLILQVSKLQMDSLLPDSLLGKELLNQLYRYMLSGTKPTLVYDLLVHALLVD